MTAGTLNVNAGSNAITLTTAGNDFTNVNVTGGSVSLLENSGFAITRAECSTSLTIDSSASVTQTGAITGEGSLVKQGTGTLNLANTNNYSGTTTVSAGTLLVNGSITSATTVNLGGTLGGGGTITGNVGGSGAVAPGNSPGTLTIVGNFGPIGVLNFEVQGYATPGTDFDRINVTGGVDLSGTVINFTGTPACPCPSSIDHADRQRWHHRPHDFRGCKHCRWRHRHDQRLHVPPLLQRRRRQRCRAGAVHRADDGLRR